MDSSGFRIRIDQNQMCDGYRVYAFLPGADGRGRVATSVTLEEYEPYSVLGEPTARLSRDTVQDVFNQLWIMGFRPADGTGNSGHLAAVKDHASDLKEIVTRLLDQAETV